MTYGPVPRETALLAQSTPASACAPATRSLSPGPLCTLSTARSLCQSLAELNRPPASPIRSIALHCPHPLPHASHHVSVLPASSNHSTLHCSQLAARSRRAAVRSSQWQHIPRRARSLQPLPLPPRLQTFSRGFDVDACQITPQLLFRDTVLTSLAQPSLL